MTAGWTYQYQYPYPIAAPAARLFQALTRNEELESWFAERASVDPRPGGDYRFWGRHTLGSPAEADAAGKVIELERDEKLVFDWEVLGVPSRVAITLEPDGDGTKVAVKHDLSGELDQVRPREMIDDWWRFALGNLICHTTGTGQVLRPDFDDPKPEIRVSMTVEVPVARVWRALTEPEALKRWMMAPDPVVEPRVGGRYQLGWKMEIDGREVAGGPMKILEFSPERRLTVDWPDWRGDQSVPIQTVTWLLEPAGSGTKVTVVHSGFVRTVDFSDYPFGWGHFISEMARVAATL